MSDTVYQIITDKIVAMLKDGVAPWHRPWNSGNAPRSITGHVYTGINVFLLLAAGFESPYWITFNQVNQRGGRIKDAERKRYTVIVFWKIIEVKDKETGDKKKVPFLRYFKVWNLDQVDGVKPPKEKKATPPPRFEDRHKVAKSIVDNYPNPPKIRRTGDQAFYQPMLDVVTVPPVKSFHSADEYYSTLFHELGHSTAHESRLDRDVSYVFGSHSYGREELVAEMTSAFLAAESGITLTINNSAAYLNSWMRTIQEDVRAVVVAATRAQKAADFILGRYVPAEENSDDVAKQAVA